jgi:hypothetical protein
MEALLGSRAPDERGSARRVVRRHAVALLRWARPQHGFSGVCDAVGAAPRTLWAWSEGWRSERLAAKPPGRAPTRAAPPTRRAVRAWLAEHGESTGVASLKAAFSFLPFSELSRLKRHFVRQRQRVARAQAGRLHWRRAGVAWAIDFTHAPLESGERESLVVRDLASRATLLARPCGAPDARASASALRSLFLEHGAPLVVKRDNGSPFAAAATETVLRHFGVVSLASPVRRPAYNGSCEAGIRWLKERARHAARRRGAAARWTADDLVAGLREGNEILRPFGWRGPSPAQAFARRTPIADPERKTFRETVERYAGQERARRGPDPGARTRACAQRAATRRALVDLGYLEIKTRRVSPPISALFSADNS